jgi:dTMP kinase
MLLDATDPIAPETEAYLMTAARAEHVRQVIEPALRSGTIVISDRFVDSTLAYQGAGRGLPIAVLAALQELAVGLLCPDLTILLDIDVRDGLVRRSATGEINRIDREDVLFHERVAEWFRAAALAEPQRWAVISGAGTRDAVHAAVLAAVQRCMPQPACSGREGYAR